MDPQECIDRMLDLWYTVVQDCIDEAVASIKHNDIPFARIYSAGAVGVVRSHARYLPDYVADSYRTFLNDSVVAGTELNAWKEFFRDWCYAERLLDGKDIMEPERALNDLEIYLAMAGLFACEHFPGEVWQFDPLLAELYNKGREILCSPKDSQPG